MKRTNNKEIEAILWLTATMPMNKIFKLKDDQIEIIKDIFLLSGIGLPTKPNEAYPYYFDIAEDWSTIKK